MASGLDAKPGKSGSEVAEDEEEEEEEDEEEAAAEAAAAEEEDELVDWVTDEIRELRGAKAAERDAAVQRILGKSKGSSCPSLEDALGVAQLASESEVGRHARKLLRLLHPDYSINVPLKGTKQQRRIEKAFKRLNELWASARDAAT